MDEYEDDLLKEGSPTDLPSATVNSLKYSASSCIPSSGHGVVSYEHR